MGLALLIAALLAGLFGCTPPVDEETRRAAGVTIEGDPHAGLTCVACHRGERAEAGRAAVPAAACAAAGCHDALGPARVELATATFRHRDHGQRGTVQPTCAACHTHAAGGEPLRASVDACALCHRADMAETGESVGCAQCHRAPGHVRLTSQGAPVAHGTLAALGISCTRCHYDVSAPPTQVSLARCEGCHRRLEDAIAGGIGEDLHPMHQGFTCTACHQPDTHRVQAMSSAVSLICNDCHRAAHDRPAEALPRPEICVSCHDGIHRAQQRLVLGLALGGRAAPSTKFLAGMSCRSCHVPPGTPAVPAGQPLRGQAVSCAGCHRAEYRTVLEWWITGTAERGRLAARYLDAAAASVGGAVDDSTRLLLEEARTMLGLVQEAGGQHNLELSDQIFREAIDRAQRAYRSAGRAAPATPELGNPPHIGLCTYCHYSPNEPWNFSRMSEEFHAAVPGGRAPAPR
jgi:hypothetical protein